MLESVRLLCNVSGRCAPEVFTESNLSDIRLSFFRDQSEGEEDEEGLSSVIVIIGFVSLSDFLPKV